VRSSANLAYSIDYLTTEADPPTNGSLSSALRLVSRKVHYGSPWVDSRMRRSLDIAAAVCALTLLSPALLACALLVVVSSPGPILFRQRRMGRNGKEFDFYKFRSMAIGAHCGGATHTVAGDVRITRVGAFLRRFKLDELPQFWNVLKGDMSLVGPRPKLARHEALRMAFRPGLTGKATLAFRNEEQLLTDLPKQEVDAFYETFIKPVKAEIDADYMRRATLFSDIHLLCLTAVSCFNISRGNHIHTLYEVISGRKYGAVQGLQLVPGARSGSPGSNPAPAAAD
jgi:lipopolysaccharide/colanic/teichoic acid biosynthesis glycosyltransferase